jgi:hypothetical protein
MVQIPEREASVPAPSQGAAKALADNLGLDAIFGPGLLDRAAAPPPASAPDLRETKKGSLKEGGHAKLTGVGCILTLLTVAVVFGVAIPIVRWRDPMTGQPLPRTVAIISPLLIGAAVHAIASLLLRVIGVRVWSIQEKGAEK